MRLSTDLEKDKYIIFDKIWFNKDNNLINKYKHRALTVYCLFMRGYTYRQEVLTTLDYITCGLNISLTNTIARNQIIEILEIFSKEDILKYQRGLSECAKHNYMIIGKLTKEIDSYIYLYDFEFQQIMNCTQNINKDMLLTVFTYLKSCINSETLVAYPTLKTIQENTGIVTDNSVLRYISILKEMGLILYRNVGLRVFKDKSVKEAGNIYTMNYEGYDKYLEQQLDRYKEELESKGVKISDKVDSNKKRSDAMKLYWEDKKKINNP